MEAKVGKPQTDYGKAVCEVLSAQVTWLIGRRKKTQQAIDLVEIKRVLMGMRTKAAGVRRGGV